MKMLSRGKTPIAMLLLSAAPLLAQDQAIPTGQQFSQAGSVSVDMATGEPIQAPQTTEILAIYRGPGYFDEALLSISSSSAPAPSQEADPASQTPSSNPAEWIDQAPPTDQQEALPPPPVLPPMAEEAPATPPLETSPPPLIAPPDQPEVLPQVESQPDSPPAPELPATPATAAPDTSSSALEGSLDGEPLPPPPMLEALPAFPQGE